MERYTPEDLYRLKWQELALRHLHNCPRADINTLLESWFEQPELRPKDTQSTLSAYDGLSRKGLEARITEIDWPEGLTMIQLSHLEMAGFLNRKRKLRWMTVKLMAHEKQTIDFSIDVTDVRQKLQDNLGRTFKCHVYGMAGMDQNTIWYRVLMFDDRHWDILPASSAILIHFYNTEYFLISCPNEMKRLCLEQSLVKAFGARELKKQALTSKTLEVLANLIEHRKSLGVFNQFRYMQQDPIQNPLNFGRLSSASKNESNNNSDSDSDHEIDTDDSDSNSDNDKDEHEHEREVKNQQAAITSMSQLASLHQNQYAKKIDFVASNEEKRRIIPIQSEKMNHRYNSVEQVFGNYSLDGMESLNIKLRHRVTPVLLDHGISIRDKDTDQHMNKDKTKRDKDEDRMAKFFRDDEEADQELNESFKNDDESGNEHDDESDNEGDSDGGGGVGSIDDHWESTTDKVEDAAPDDPCALTIEIKCNGTNVMAGLRDLALHGFMESPYPPWMMDLVASGTSRVLITDTKMELISDMV